MTKFRINNFRDVCCLTSISIAMAEIKGSFMKNYLFLRKNFRFIFVLFFVFLYPNLAIAETIRTADEIIPYFKYNPKESYCIHEINNEVSVSFQSHFSKTPEAGNTNSALYNFAVIKIPYTAQNKLNYEVGSVFDVGYYDHWNKAKLLKIDKKSIYFAVDTVFLYYLWGSTAPLYAGNRSSIQRGGPYFYFYGFNDNGGINERLALSRAITCSIEESESGGD